MFLHLLRRELDFRRQVGEDGQGIVAPIVDHHVEGPRTGERYAPFIALRYYSEGSLSTALQDEGSELGRLTGAEAERVRLELVAQVADLVHHLHCRGVYHGDVRAANVLIERNVTLSRLVAWLTDLGNAGSLTDTQGESTGAPETRSQETEAAVGQEGLEPEHSPRGYLASQSVLGVNTTEPSTPREAGSGPRIPPVQTAADRVAGDIAQLGTVLYQCAVNKFDSTLELRGVWQDRVCCPVLRRIIEDTQRAGRIGTAEELARCIRQVSASRMRRQIRRVGLLAGLLFAVATVSATGWWLTADNLRLARNIAIEQERAQTKEIVRRGDIADLAGAQDEARTAYRQALQRRDVDGTAVQARLHQKILRASLFLDDPAAVEEELRWLDGKGKPRVKAPAVLLDKAVYELELAMRDYARKGLVLSEHEKRAAGLLKEVSRSADAALEDQLTAKGLLAPTYAEAEKRFEQALEEAPFHPYATVYLVSTAMLAGRLEKAADRARIWQMMSPKDPAPLLHQAFILTLMGKRGEARQVLQGINNPLGPRRRLPADTVAAFKAVTDVVATIQDLLDEALLDPVGRGQFAWLLVTRLPAAMGGFANTRVFRVPLLPAQRQDLQRFLHAVKVGNRLLFPRPAEALDELGTVGSFVPEGLTLFFSGKCHLALGDKAKAAKMFELAAERPALFDVRRLCWLAAANYRIGLATKAKPEEAGTLKREARVLIRRCVALGAMTGAFRSKVIECLIRSDGLDFAEELAAEVRDRKTLEKFRRLQHR